MNAMQQTIGKSTEYNEIHIICECVGIHEEYMYELKIFVFFLHLGKPDIRYKDKIRPTIRNFSFPNKHLSFSSNEPIIARIVGVDINDLVGF